jgi:GT2 family glycosyltransferase
MKVTVVIPTYNRCDDLERCIRALFKQDYPTDRYDIVIVDNSSTDATPKLVARMQERSVCRMRYFVIPPGGPAKARNYGMAQANGDAVAFVDSDVNLDPKWLQHTSGLMQNDDKIGIVSGKLVYASRPDRLNAFGGELGRIGLGWDRHEGELSSRVNDTIESLWVSGAALLARLSLAKQMGGFDVTFFYGYEDSDFGWRMNLYGGKVVCTPDAIAYHCVNEEVSKSDPRIVFHYCKNRLRSMLKNYGLCRLVIYLPIYLAYTVLDATVRPPHLAKLRALLWNVVKLPNTLLHRWKTQYNRVEPDRNIAHLFNRRFFAPVTLSGRRRRPVDASSTQPVLQKAAFDDRVH